MSDREKQVDGFTLTYTHNEVLVKTALGEIGRVQMAIIGTVHLVVSRSGHGVPIGLAQEASAFLTECLADQAREKLSKFRCEVEYVFERSGGGGIAVFLNGTRAGTVYRDSLCSLPGEVVAAARKFAGWDR